MKRVLYVESGSGYGGSAESLYQLLKNLSCYHPSPLRGEGSTDFHVQRKSGAVFDSGYPARIKGRVRGNFDIKIDSKSLARDKVEPYVFMYSESPILKKIRALGLKVWVRRALLPTALLLIYLVWRYRLDVLHLNNDLDSHVAGLLAGKVTGRRIYLHLRGIRKWTRAESILKHWVFHWIAVSQAVRKHLIEQGIPNERITVLYNQVEIPLDVKDQRKKEVYTVGNFNRWVPGKGHDDFFKAIVQINGTIPDIRYLLLEPPKENSSKWASELVNQLKNSEAGEKIRFVPWTEDIFAHLSECDVVVNPSRLNESFGRLLVESMAAGCVVVATDVGAHPEIIKDGENGILVPAGASYQLARTIVELYSDVERRKHLGENARALAVETFHDEAYGEHVSAIYSRGI